MLIPDMVPGRVQTMSEDFPLPTDELMVRWTECSAVMPIMQFSYFPWNYAAGTEQAVLGLARLHRALGPYIAASAANRRAPLVRPLWYDAPGADELYTAADVFMLGPDLVAAPVLVEGAVERDVLLPPGGWRDAWTGETIDGGLHAQYPAPCPGMPVFVRVGNKQLFKAAHSELSRVNRGSVATGIRTATYRAGLNRDLGVTG
jgi:alpha-glucosidase (family GH31 glycosyl hydrolase)